MEKIRFYSMFYILLWNLKVDSEYENVPDAFHILDSKSNMCLLYIVLSPLYSIFISCLPAMSDVTLSRIFQLIFILFCVPSVGCGEASGLASVNV